MLSGRMKYSGSRFGIEWQSSGIWVTMTSRRSTYVWELYLRLLLATGFTYPGQSTNRIQLLIRIRLCPFSGYLELGDHYNPAIEAQPDHR